MILIPEQIVTMRQKINRYKEERKGYFEQFEENLKNNVIEGFKIGTQDVFTKKTFEQLQDDSDKAYDLLINSQYLQERDTDKIAIGTTFEVEFADGEKETYTLVEDMFGLSSLDNFISIKSTFGKALLAKKEQDEFSYIIETPTKTEIKGKITAIKKDKKDYPYFIKTKNIKNRYSPKVKKANKKEQTPSSKSVQLTVSQLNLLNIEYERLSRQPQNNQKTIQRLAYIKKLLSSAEIAHPLPDNIDIGSKFTIMLNVDGKKIYKNLELINYAVSDEINDEYLEKISTLGITLLGLHENDTFVLHRFNNSDIKGIVISINNKSSIHNRKMYIKNN